MMEKIITKHQLEYLAACMVQGVTVSKLPGQEPQLEERGTDVYSDAQATFLPGTLSLHSEVLST